MERKRNKLGKRIFAFFLAALMCSCLLPVSANALAKIDTERKVSLKLIYADGSRALEDVEFSLYRVAEVTENARCRLVGDFKQYEDAVTLKGLDASGWKNAALTLKGYVQRDAISATKTAKTNTSGEFTLANLETGLYLVLGNRTKTNGYIYTAEPFLLFLPGLNEVSDTWQYDVSIYVKYDRESSGGGGGNNPETKKSWKVLKVWKDEGDREDRPREVIIQLLRDGKLYDSVVLKEENNWRYTWENLSTDYEWMIVEKDEENYTTSIAREGTTFVVTNTHDKEESEIPEDEIPGEEPQGEEPSGAEEFEFISDEENPLLGAEADEEKTHDAKEKLPQTGALWWPVPILCSGGLILILIGCFIKRRQMDEE